jgi:hypothetical protein
MAGIVKWIEPANGAIEPGIDAKSLFKLSKKHLVFPSPLGEGGA